MTRKNKNKNPHRSVTIHFDDAFALAVDQYVIGLGLENRAAGIVMLATAGMSSVPLDAAIGLVMQQATRETKKAEFEALALHFENRAAIYRAALK